MHLRIPNIGLVLAVLASCALAGCKETAEVVVEKGVKAAKDTTTGIEEGIDKGRRSGESTDGASIVSSPQDLAGKGTLAVHSVGGGPDAGLDAGARARTEIVLAVENLGDKPLRLTKLAFSAFDRDGFVKQVESAPTEVTVPSHAKEKVTLVVGERAELLAKIRYWNVDLPLR